MTGSQDTGQEPASSPVPTERFQRVLAFASDEADGLGHGFVTCQHLLYALSCESKGLAGAVLERLSVSPDVLHEFLAEADASHDRTALSHIDLADEARDAIERAVSAAAEWQHRVLDTEHLLYGIVTATTSADEILSALQIDPNDVIKQLFEFQQSAPSTDIREEATHAYRFALESAWLLSLSTDIARRHASRQVTSLHLLAALVSQPNPSHDVLVESLGLPVDDLLRLIPSSTPPVKTKGRLPLAEDVQMILGYAIGEAWNRGHLSVTPMHLAMGLARSEQNLALDILADLGIPRATLIDALEQAMPPATER